MYRTALICIIIMSIRMNSGAELPVDISVQSEYKQDTIDYSSTERYFFREKLGIFFSMESSLNLSYIYLRHEEIYKYTWNLALNDISPRVSFLFGNYFVHFGTGLLLGRKRFYEPDIFADREMKPGNVFSPCNTGNPAYAFSGASGIFRMRIMDIDLTFNLFYSIKERFTDQESYESGEISSMLSTIDTKITNEYNHNEPVQIYTKGGMFSARFLKYVHMQTYFLMTDLRSQYKDEISWDNDETYDESYSVAGLNGFGIFAGYKDDFFSFIADYALTQKEAVYNDNVKMKEYGHGTIFGLEFTPAFLSMSIIWKRAGDMFYSPYSSSVGEDYPETAWFFNARVNIYSNLTLFLGLSSQKRTGPSSADSGLPVTERAKSGILYSYGIIKKFDIRVRRVEKTGDDNTEKLQVKTSSDIGVTKSFRFLLSLIHQNDSCGHNSAIYGAGCVFVPRRFLKIDFHYLNAEISGDNIIYTITSPVRGSATPGFFVRENSNIFIFKAGLKILDCYLSSRYFHQFNNEMSLLRRLEVFAYGYF